MAAGSSAHPRVALHVLAADGSDPAVSALIHAHGDRLARLDHPAIPRLLDGGVTAEGSVYLASEFATGDAIDEWCRHRRLSLRDRVDRVIDVCEAVQHAHEHLVAHGDLRPSNILVSADAKLKLINCGMAALLRFEAAHGGAAAPVHPSMSPEQARGEVLTAASDVYALGILLYTLLTGYPPYELGGQTPARARHMICETTPDVPSTIVGGAIGASWPARSTRHPEGVEQEPARTVRDGRRAGRGPACVARRPAGVGGALRGVVARGHGQRLARGAARRGGRRDRRAGGRRGRPRMAGRSLARRARPGPREPRRRRAAAAGARGATGAAAGGGPAAPDRRTAPANLALAERRRGDAAKAEALWAQSLADVRPLLAADPVDVRALETGPACGRPSGRSAGRSAASMTRWRTIARRSARANGRPA